MYDSKYNYTLFVDEAGDPGLKRVVPIDKNGASEWLIVSGVLINNENEHLLPYWIDDLKQSINKKFSPIVHYKNLSATNRLKVCKKFAEISENRNKIVAFVIATNKQNMKGYENPIAAMIPSENWFYCWLTRLLLERVTNFVQYNSIRKYGQTRKLKVIFSERGGITYSQMNAYFDWLRIKSNNGRVPLYLPYGNIYFDVLDRELFEIKIFSSSPELLLPDIIASAFFDGLEFHNKDSVNVEPAKSLRSAMASEPISNYIGGYGFKIMPSFGKLKACSLPQQLILPRFYGYPSNYWFGEFK